MINCSDLAAKNSQYMKTKAELEQDIINITMKIYHEFPELSKYFAEMPLKLSGINNGGMSTKDLKEYSNSLEELLVSYSRTHKHTVKVVKIGTDALQLAGDPNYSPSEDISYKGKKEMELNPEELSKSRVSNEVERTTHEKDFEGDISGKNFDVPGSELDDKQVNVCGKDGEK